MQLLSSPKTCQTSPRPLTRPVRTPLPISSRKTLILLAADWNALCPAYNKYTAANQIPASGPAALVPAEIPNPKPNTNSSIPS